MKVTPISNAVAEPMASNTADEPKTDQYVDVTLPLHGLEHAGLGMEAVASLIIERTPAPNSDEDEEGHGARIQYLVQQILETLDRLHEAQCRVEAAATWSRDRKSRIVSQVYAEQEGRAIAGLIDSIDIAIGLISRNVPKENDRDERYFADMDFLVNCLFGHSEDIEQGVLPKLLGYDRHASKTGEAR